MNKSGVLGSFFLRLCFAAFLVVFGLIAAFIAGMSGDAGPNPVFVYLCLSVMLFVGTGVVILISPASFLFSSSKSSKWLWFTFLFSIAHPFIALAFAALLKQTNVSKGENSRRQPYHICITQRSANPDNLAWVELGREGGSYQRWPENLPLQPGESRCKNYSLPPGITMQYVVYQSTPSNARHSGQRQSDLGSQALKLKPEPNESICLGLYPPKENGQWQIVRESCGR